MRTYTALLPALLLLLIGNLRLYSQDIPSAYLDTALSQNRVVLEKKAGLGKSLLALREAKRLFLPTSQFEAQYTLARGGRTIDIPIGDLLNPVYETLNQLTASNTFHNVENAAEQLNPNNFYDLRIRNSMPLLQPDIRYTRDIRALQVEMSQLDLDQYKRELILQVKQAYYQYQQSLQAILIYQRAREVVQEQYRVTQSLLENGKGLPAYVSRAESELKAVETQLLQAHNSQVNALAYFNFLLNRPLTTAVPAAPPLANRALPEAALPASLPDREELQQLYKARAIQQVRLKQAKAYRVPRINAFVDLAAQGFDFTVKRQSFFYLAGIQLQLPLFAGSRNLIRIQQTELDQKQLELHTGQALQQLELAVLVSQNNLNVARSSFQSSRKQEEAAERYFNLIAKGYKEGVNSFIEYLDARNQLTQSQLQRTIRYYQILSALADYERQTATYPLK